MRWLITLTQWLVKWFRFNDQPRSKKDIASFQVRPSSGNRPFVISTIATTLRKLAWNGYYTLELVFTGNLLTVHVTTPKGVDAMAFAAALAAANPDLVPFPSKVDPLPRLKPGMRIRVGAARLWRDATQMIQTRFGVDRQGHAEAGGDRAPLTHIVEAVPPLPDGVTVIVQVAFNRFRGLIHPFWRRRPAPPTSALPSSTPQPTRSHSKDTDAMRFYASLRVVQLQEADSRNTTNFVKLLSHAMGVWTADNALKLRSRFIFGRLTHCAILRAVWHRTRTPLVGWRQGVAYTAHELAALVHLFAQGDVPSRLRLSPPKPQAPPPAAPSPAPPTRSAREWVEGYE